VQLTLDPPLPYWSSGASRQFQVIYTRASNTMEVRIYNNGSTTAYGYYDFTPTGGPSPVNAVWTLPATSFFASAQTGTGSASISVSGLSLSGVNGAITVLSPLTSLATVTNNGGAATVTSQLSQNAVFLADPTGSWMLSGFVTMNFTGTTNSPDRLQFGLTATANTPEPSVFLTIGLGLVSLGLVRRRAKSRAEGRAR
jgi:hypothetical protein